MDMLAAGVLEESGDHVALAGDFLLADRTDPLALDVGRVAMGTPEDLHELVPLAGIHPGFYPLARREDLSAEGTGPGLVLCCGLFTRLEQGPAPTVRPEEAQEHPKQDDCYGDVDGRAEKDVHRGKYTVDVNR